MGERILTDMKLLTVEEVMDLLRMSRDTVYRLAARGQLPGRKIGRAWRFPADELERYLRRSSSGSRPAGTEDPVSLSEEPRAARTMSAHEACPGA